MTISLEKQEELILGMHMFIKETYGFIQALILFHETLSDKEKTYFDKTITYLKSGVSYAEAIQFIKPVFERSLFPLFLILGKHPNPAIISEMLVNHIKQLISFKTLKNNLLRYPKWLMMLLMVLICVYILIVVPMYQQTQIFESIENQSVFFMSTQISTYIHSNPIVIVYSVMLMIFFSFMYQKFLKIHITKIVYWMPFMRKTFLYHVYYKFTFGLFSLLKAKVYMIEALSLTSMMTEHMLKKGIQNSIEHILEGRELHLMLEKMPHQPKDMHVFMQHVSNENQLLDILFIMSKRYENKYLKRLEMQYKMISPIMLAIIALMVLSMFYVLYAPIFDLYDQLLT
jgi:type II secretory pathway component PulF